MMLTKRSATIAAPLLLACGFALPALAQPAAMGGPKVLIHGNYCGPGNNAPLPPIDALDAACARHDACTPEGGLPSKACNLRLQQDAARIADDPRQPDDLRALAGIFAATASLIPSEPGVRQVPASISDEAAPRVYTPVPRGSAPAADAFGDPDDAGAE